MLKALLVAAAYLAAVANGDDDVLVHVMSFNIRTSLASGDSASTCSNWDGIRKDNVVSNINTVAADFIGTQETSDAQKTYLDAQLAGTYSVIGESTGSLNGNANEWDALYYRTDTWTLLTNGMFWLGTDPDTMSAGWDMTYYRTCVWGRFQHITTGATICVMNTHYETPGNDEAQENGSNIILERMSTYCDAGDNLIVLVGDFNALKSYSAMQILLANNLADPSDAPTFCGDMLSATCTVKYDFTLYRTQSDDACHLASDVSRIDYDGCYSSDHAGLVGSFCLQGSCCSDNSSSSSGSIGSYGSYSQDQNQESVAGEEDVLGTVQASDTSGSVIGDTTTSSSSGSAQTISTSSSGGSSASTTVGIILGCLGAVGIVAVVVIRRKRMLDAKAHMEKSSFDPTQSYFSGAGAAGAVSDMSALSPLAEGERVSNSPIPELVALPRDSRNSRSSSVSVSESEKARHDSGRRSSEASSIRSRDSSRRSSTTILMGANSSQFSSTYGVESEGGFSASMASYSESYGNSSMAESKVNFSEIFEPGSCVSDDGALAKSQADFAKL
ncbi:hypothetical protein BBJ28_00013653 [Nothophytophthora sp. Chile5]|nr:hypothetical protein BBJ28_00013653 [Nothophytophthora sp. Chile5]